MTDVVMACDMIVGSGLPVLKTVRQGRTAAILQHRCLTHGRIPDQQESAAREDAIARVDLRGNRRRALFELPASKLATALTGDSIGTNILMLGYAAQQGLLPVSLASIREAIRLNGTFVDGKPAHVRTGDAWQLMHRGVGAGDRGAKG